MKITYTWPTWLWFFCLIGSLRISDWLAALVILLLAPLAMWYEEKLYQQSRKQP